MPDTVLNTLRIISLKQNNPARWYYCHPQFTGKGTEARRDWKSELVNGEAKWGGFEQRLSDHQLNFPP